VSKRGEREEELKSAKRWPLLGIQLQENRSFGLYLDPNVFMAISLDKMQEEAAK
jgi:hypothetical protein